MLHRHRVVLCDRPSTLSFTIVHRAGMFFGPLGRCLHTILPAHHLVIWNGGQPIEVIDTVAGQERRRTERGFRPPGWFGSRTGFSPHRCDRCKRERELAATIICPCCRHTIPVGGKVSLISTDAVWERTSNNADVLPYATTTADEKETVVCEACGEGVFDDQDEPGTWSGDSVVMYPSAEDIS